MQKLDLSSGSEYVCPTSPKGSSKNYINTNQTYTNYKERQIQIHTNKSMRKFSLSSGSKYVCPTSPDWSCYVTLIVIIHKYKDKYKPNIHKYKDKYRQIQIHPDTCMCKLDAIMSARLPLLCCYAMQIVINTNINQTNTNTNTNIHKYLSSGWKYVCPTSADWCCYAVMRCKLKSTQI